MVASTLGKDNPFRYRNYFYDSETGLYYLGSRYYNPATGRFVNADGYISTGQGILGNNMFAYALNNPVLYSDHSGNIAVSTTFAAIAAFAFSFLNVKAITSTNLRRDLSNAANYLYDKAKKSLTRFETALKALKRRKISVRQTIRCINWLITRDDLSISVEPPIWRHGKSLMRKILIGKI